MLHNKETITFNKADLDPDIVLHDKRFSPNFSITLNFRPLCPCSPFTPPLLRCPVCAPSENLTTATKWAGMIGRIDKINMMEFDAAEVLFGDYEADDITSVL